MKLKLAAFAVLLGLTTTFLGACDNAGTGGAGESPAIEPGAAPGQTEPGVEEPTPTMSPMTSPTTSP